MNTNYLELATNAIAIELVKGDHENQNADVHTVNARVSHWNISAMTIYGTPVQEWCAQFGIDIDFMLRHDLSCRFKTKKEVLPWVAERFAEQLCLLDPERNCDASEEWKDRMYAAFDSLKAGK